MAQRLAVDAGGDDVRGGETRPAERRGDRVGIGVGQRIRRARGARELVAAGALQRQQLGGEVARERDLHRRQQRRTAAPAAGAKSAMTASTPSRLVPDITPA